MWYDVGSEKERNANLWPTLTFYSLHPFRFIKKRDFAVLAPNFQISRIWELKQARNFQTSKFLLSILIEVSQARRKN